MIADNLGNVHKQIQDVCQKIGRAEEEITLVGVTKYSEASDIEEAIAGGLCHVGENRVQAAREKFPLIKNLDQVTRHLIGHLQTNKVKHAVELFDIIQSVDSIKLVDEIQKQGVKTGKVVQILVQINVAAEEQKYGVDKETAFVLLDHIRSLDHVNVLGLMTMAPFVEDENIIRASFRGLKKIFDESKERYRGSANIEMQYLSMGMSGDYAIALEEGANMVRIGSAIFK